MKNLKYMPIYKGKVGYTPNLYEREQNAKEYSKSCKKEHRINLDFSEVTTYGIASALLCLLATIIL